MTEEKITANNKKKLLTHYRDIFIEAPHLEIPLISMNMSFDYTKMVSLEKQGTVYPNIWISDKWRILTVKKSLLLSPEWNKVHLSNPLRFGNNSVAGDGWELELREAYTIKEGANGNYYLKDQ